MDDVKRGCAEGAEGRAEGSDVDIAQPELRRDRGRVQPAPAAEGQDSRPGQIDTAAVGSDGQSHLRLKRLFDRGGGAEGLRVG